MGRSRGAEIGGAIAVEPDGQPYVPLHDQRGNTTVLLSADGSPVEIYRYSAFGETKIFAPNGDQRTNSVVGFCWRYSSKRTDEETGLIYFGRRYYDPTLLNWITPDPKGLEEGPNLYAYCLANPLRYCDVWGLATMNWREEHQQMRDRSRPIANSFLDGMASADYAMFGRPTPLPQGNNYWGRKTVCAVAPQFDYLAQNWTSLSGVDRKEIAAQGAAHAIGFGISAGANISAAVAACTMPVLGPAYALGVGTGKAALHLRRASVLRSGLPIATAETATAVRILGKNPQGDLRTLCNTVQDLQAISGSYGRTRTWHPLMSPKIKEAEGRILDWLGKPGPLRTNQFGDIYWLSADGNRKFRIDYSNPRPHKNPHCDLEQFDGVGWKKETKVYPCDVVAE